MSAVGVTRTMAYREFAPALALAVVLLLAGCGGGGGRAVSVTPAPVPATPTIEDARIAVENTHGNTVVVRVVVTGTPAAVVTYWNGTTERITGPRIERSPASAAVDVNPAGEIRSASVVRIDPGSVRSVPLGTLREDATVIYAIRSTAAPGGILRWGMTKCDRPLCERLNVL